MRQCELKNPVTESMASYVLTVLVVQIRFSERQPMVDEETLKAWFLEEIFPLEEALTRFIQRNWRNDSDVPDLRQDVYARLYSSAREVLPSRPKPFLFAIARNHLINCAKRSRIVSIEHFADLDSMDVAIDCVTPDRHETARAELSRVQAGLDRLPARCREAVMLRKIEGLSIREAADRMGVGVDTIERQLVLGMRALTDFMLGGTGKIRRSSSKRALNKEGCNDLGKQD